MEPPIPREIEKMDVHDLKEEIRKKAQTRRCLIVLDDVWEQEVYFKISDVFLHCQASCIIITTRKDHVSAIASSGHHLELQPLGGPDAFELFCRRAFHNKKDHECPEELVKVATSLVDRCQGLPLVITSMGSYLSSRPLTHYTWNQIYNQLQGELSNNYHVRAILDLSYHDLSEDLRNCFLYCSLFPAGYPISRESLVRLWVAEGFVLRKEKNTAEEVAELNLMELIDRNMLVMVENDEQGRVNTCRMNEILRELVLADAKVRRLGSANGDTTMIQMDRNVRRLSFHGWEDGNTLKVRLPCLRTVVSIGTVSSCSNMLSSILSESIYLTVLELQDSEVTEVPACIGTLFNLRYIVLKKKNLRYIGLRRTKVKSLPESVEKLSNLHTLDIKQTKIEKLPRGIAKVKKLQHLLADRYDDEKLSAFRYFQGIQPPKDLSNLENLQTLETVKASKKLAGQLKKLMQLRSLWIDNISCTDCANLFAALSNMPRDENEALSFVDLKPSTELHKLIIGGQWANRTLECPIFRGHGMHLKYLALSWCNLREDPLEFLAQHVPNLKYLSLNRVNSASTLVLPTGCFPHLITLLLKRMPDVKQLEIQDGALPRIDRIYIVSLAQLHKIPQGIESLPSLKKLWMLYVHRDFAT